MNSWERTVRNVIDDDLFVAFYAGMDGYVDWVTEVGGSHEGFPDIQAAARLFRTWMPCFGEL